MINPRLCAGLVLVAALLLAGIQSVGRLSAGPSERGLTLVISPSILLAGQPAILTIRAIDSSAHPVAGVALAISGANMPMRRLVTGNGALTLRVTPARKSPLRVQASRAGYRAIGAAVTVVPPRPPANVTVLSPSVGLRAVGVSLFRPARRNDPLFFQWRARTDSRQRGALTFADGSVLDMDRNTEVRLKDATRTFLQSGQVFVQVLTGGQSHDVETGTSVAASLGTRYVVRVRGGVTTVTVLSGRVNLRAHNHSVSIGANQQSSVSAKHNPSTPVHVQASQLIGWTAGLPVATGSGSPRSIYFTRNGGAILSTFSVDQQKVLDSKRLPAIASDIAFSTDGKYVLLATNAGLYRVARATGKLEPLYLREPLLSLAILPGHQVVAAAPQRRALVTIDTLTGKVVARVALGYAPLAVAASPAGALAAAVGAGNISLVDLRHHTVLMTRTLAGSAGKPAFSSDGQNVIVPVGRTIVTFSVSARGQINTIPIARGGTGAVAVAAASLGLAYVANATSKSIDTINLAAGKRTASIAINVVPRSILVASDGKLFVVSDNPGMLLEIDPTDGYVLARTAVLGAAAIGAPGALAPAAPPPPIAGTADFSTLVVSSVPQVEAIPIAPSTQPVASPTTTATSTDTLTPSPSPTNTATRLAPSTQTATATPTASITSTPSQTSTATQTPTATPIPVPIVEFGLGNQKSAPAGIIMAPDGAMWFAEQGAGKVARFDTSTGEITGQIHPGAAIIIPYAPHDGTVAPDGTVWFTDVSKNAVVQYAIDPATGGPAPVTLLALTRGSQPDGIVSANGAMFVAEPGAGDIIEISRPNGAWAAGPAIHASAPPQRLALGPDGNVWFTERNTGLIGRLNPSTLTLTEFNFPGTLPIGITGGPDGNIWFADSGQNQIVRIDPSGKMLNAYSVPTASAGLTGIAAGPDSHIWFTEANADKLGSVDPSTGATREFPLGTRPAGPAYLAVGPPLPSGHHTLWFTETTSGKIGYAEIP